MMDRRSFLLSGTLAGASALSACKPSADYNHIDGSFTGINVERGHWLRDHLKSGKPWPEPSATFKTQVLVAGSGIAGLAAARALRLQRIEDFAVLELEDTAGGNSRGAVLNGLACPQGAHYLPLPGDDAPEVQDLLEELCLRTRVAGRWQYDERHLCHSPQERLFFNGQWQDGLLPMRGLGADTLAQYRKFAALVEQARTTAHWNMPYQPTLQSPTQATLAAMTFATYLDQQGLRDVQLRWYLDYCCRDDFGAGMATVSAWAGIHYFASRHGFHAPGQEAVEREGLLTWPEGNAWLARRLAAPLGERLNTGRMVVRIANRKQGVEVDAFNTATQTMERWQAERAVVALPVFVAARVVQDAPDFLRQAAQQTVYAPWLVANMHLTTPLHDRPGAAPSWDNVLYNAGTNATGLGYVDASHQILEPVFGATVLTHYRALGDVPGGHSAGRKLVLERPWSAWRDEIVAELSRAHPDLAAKTTRIDITRYGHAMAMPVPQSSGRVGVRPTGAALAARQKNQPYPDRLVPAWERLRFAHADWAGYSVFEEAFTLGHAAGYAAAA